MWPVIVGGPGIIVVLLALFWPFTVTAPEEAITSIAVLPFENMSNDPGMEYLSDGVAQSIIYSLSQLPQVKVIPFSSVLPYKGQDINSQQVAGELGVRALLIGRLNQQGADLFVNVELVDTQDNSVLWGDQYREKVTDLMQVQDKISMEISENLRWQLSGEEQRMMTKRYTENTEAYRSYLEGRYWWNKRTEEGFRKAIESFLQAIVEDPSYAQAYAGLADSYNMLGQYEIVSPSEAFPRAEAAALRALDLDETLAEAHTSLGWTRMSQWRWQEAGREFQRAIELNPGYATAHHWYARYLWWSPGRLDEALAEIKRAQELDPLSLIINSSLGEALGWAGRYDEAIEQFRKTLELNPNFAPAHQFLSLPLAQKSMYEEAIVELEKAVSLSGGSAFPLSWLGYFYGVAGRKGEAESVLDQLQERSKQSYVSAASIALIYVGLGRKDEAFDWLERSYQAQEPLLPLKVDPMWDPLRDDPRFHDLLRRMNLMP